MSRYVVVFALLGSLPVLTVACSGLQDASDPSCYDQEAPEPISMPGGLPFETWDSGVLVLNLELCPSGRWSQYLPYGSAWVGMQSNGDHCEMWLGGETEDPRYNGSATQYCRFLKRGCEATIEVSYTGGDGSPLGGPAVINSPACTPPGPLYNQGP